MSNITPLFRTFDVDSLEQRGTSFPPSSSLIESIIEHFHARGCPILLGEIANRFDIRLDTAHSAIDLLLKRGIVVALQAHELVALGYHQTSLVYRLRPRLSEKVRQDRMPPPPEHLVGAMHDCIHKESGSLRAAISFKVRSSSAD
jgi:hypothetical protein